MTTYYAPVTKNTLYDFDWIWKDQEFQSKFMQAGAWRGLFDSDADEWHRVPVGHKWTVIAEILSVTNLKFDQLITLYINDCRLHNVEYRLQSLVTAVHSYALVFMEAREVLVSRAKSSSDSIDWKTWASQWWDGKPEKNIRSLNEPFEISQFTELKNDGIIK